MKNIYYKLKKKHLLVILIIHDLIDLIVLCLTPLSAILQLYHGDQF